MSLQSGARLGPYEILSQSGAGGMGEVYRAKDVRLQRVVAIKVLPELFSAEPDRRERFEREARAISKLAHPHICVLHDIGHQDGIDYLVMEYLEGETLAQRLSNGALPIDQALKHAVEIADALDKAHRQGIVHRDLKPGNIMLTESGAKLLDFGLAKLRSEAGDVGLSSVATKDPTLTAEGAIVGTLQYMAPEQLEGKEADPRTDIFAFGTVLYEMLTGKKAFEGQSKAGLIAAILERDPPVVSTMTALCPRFLEHVIKRCLAKKPERRYQDIYDVRIDLEELLVETAQPAASGSVAAIGSIHRKQLLPWALTAVLIVIAAVMSWQYFRITPPARQATTRFSMATQPLAVLVHAASPAVALSPDGTHLVYVAGDSQIGQLYLRKLSSLEAKPIAGADQAHGPFFSPDGQWVAFFAPGKLQKISVHGGSPVNVCVLPAAFSHGGCWGDDGNIVFQSGNMLWRVSAEGGTAKRIATPHAVYWPDILPGSETVIVTAVPDAAGGRSSVWVLPLETGQPRLLIEGGGIARYVRSGHLVYALDGSLLAAPFDLKSLQLTGPSVAVIHDDVMMGLPAEPVVAHFAVSNTGTLAYLPGTVLSNLGTPVWVNREGQEEASAVDPRRYDWPRVSPDGSRLAVGILEPGNYDVWIYEFARQTLTRLTFDPADDYLPLWTPDGQRVVFTSNRDGQFNLFWQTADGTGQAERLISRSNPGRTAFSFSPDGKKLAFQQINPETGLDLHLLLLEGQPTPKPLLQTPFVEVSAAISPDGGWIAYSSDENGPSEINVRPFPDTGKGRWQVSTNGGTAPLWSPDGRELFYQKGEAMMVVSVETVGNFRAGSPKLLFTGKYVGGWGRNFDIAPDGRRFIMIKETGQTLDASARDQLTVVLNWFEELRQLAPAGK